MDINQLLTNKVQETIGKLVFENVNHQVQAQVYEAEIVKLKAELKALSEEKVEATDI